MTVGPAMWESGGRRQHEDAQQRLRWNRRPTDVLSGASQGVDSSQPAVVLVPTREILAHQLFCLVKANPQWRRNLQRPRRCKSCALQPPRLQTCFSSRDRGRLLSAGARISSWSGESRSTTSLRRATSCRCGERASPFADNDQASRDTPRRRRWQDRDRRRMAGDRTLFDLLGAIRRMHAHAEELRVDPDHISHWTICRRPHGVALCHRWRRRPPAGRRMGESAHRRSRRDQRGRRLRVSIRCRRATFGHRRAAMSRKRAGSPRRSRR